MAYFDLDQTYPPWSNEQVDKLNEHQHKEDRHPYTCGSGSRSNYPHRKYAEEHNQFDYGILVATNNGWICPVCNYKQNWAHKYFLE